MDVVLVWSLLVCPAPFSYGQGCSSERLWIFVQLDIVDKELELNLPSQSTVPTENLC